jgi:hypothetical protein
MDVRGVPRRRVPPPYVRPLLAPAPRLSATCRSRRQPHGAGEQIGGTGVSPMAQARGLADRPVVLAGAASGSRTPHLRITRVPRDRTRRSTSTHATPQRTESTLRPAATQSVFRAVSHDRVERGATIGAFRFPGGTGDVDEPQARARPTASKGLLGAGWAGPAGQLALSHLPKSGRARTAREEAVVPSGVPGRCRPVCGAGPVLARLQLPWPMFFVTTSRVRASSAVGLNSTSSVPAKISGVCPGRAK